MKKILIAFGVVVFLLILAIIALPVLFKDDIQKAVDETMDESLNAKVFYDTEEFSLSLIKNFPNVTLSIGDFGIVGIEDFSQDTLVSVQKFEVTIDLMSVLSGDQIKVEEILLNQPKIFVLVLENGNANYDIAKESPESNTPENQENEASDSEASSESSTVNVGIERWAIEDGSVVYLDQSSNIYTSLLGLNHEGSGDFTLDIFDLTTKTVIESVSLGYDDVDYMSSKRFEADITLNMNLPEMEFTFKENRVALNDFAIEADGYLKMPDEDIVMDVKFGGNDISLKSILSLIPGVYQEYLSGVTASGEINFDGLVSGTYNENSMPKVSANLSVSNGSISYSEFNIPMEQINIETNFDYPSADLSETSFNVNKFSMLVDGEELSSYLKFRDLENYTWDFGFEGNADLEKITKIVPLDGMTLKGKINAALSSSGQMSIIEAEQYGQLPTSGSLTVDGFYFESADLPNGFSIAKAQMGFNPSEITLDQFDAAAGKSDFKLNGSVKNYLGFALNEEVLSGSLSLNSDLIDINEFMPETDSSELEEEIPTDTTALEVVRIPENIDFSFNSAIDKMVYTNLEISNFEGRVIIRDGAIILDENSFNLLDGTFSLSGSYDTKGLEEPKYDLGFDVKDLSIASAFESFSTVQEFVPIAKQVTGKFSTNFNVNGLLGNDMMPLMDKINLEGLVNVAQAALTGGEFSTKLNSLAAFKSGAASSDSDKSISIKDVLIKTEIKDGHLFVEPFDLEVNGQKATLGGSNTLDGQLSYSMLIKEIPTGAIGSALNSAVSSLTGGTNLISDKIDIDLGIGGTYDDVKVSLLSTSPSGSTGGSSASAAFKEQITSKVDDEKAKAEAKIAEEKARAEAKAKAAADSAKAVLSAKKKATQDSINAAVAAQKKKAAESAKNKVKKLFKKKGN